MRIGIIGLGLIGGSLGLDLRNLGYSVWGVSPSNDSCQTAVAMGAVELAESELKHIPDIQATDIIVICTPIAQVLATLKELTQFVQPPTVISDVASVKGAIVPSAQSIYDCFVGAHPMAGTAGQGIHSAQKNMFQKRVCVVCAGKGMALIKQMWEGVGMQVISCTPEAHDLAVARISHLPLMVSAALINSIATEIDPPLLKLAQTLASSGFRDTSRVGGGNPELGTLMAQYNRSALLNSLKIYQSQLAELVELIEHSRWDTLQQQLVNAQIRRKEFDICHS